MPSVCPAVTVIVDKLPYSVHSVPVPEVDKLTVTSSDVVPDKVAVRVSEDPEFSAIELAEDVRVTIGPLLVIVIVTACVPFSVADPPDTVSIATIAVSFPSSMLSSVGVKDTVPVVAPAEIVILDILE